MKPEVVKTYPFLDSWRVKGAQYMKVPKEMLRMGKEFGLGMDEVALYAVLRDRANLSFKNGWIDENGRVYIVFPRDKVAEYIGWSKRKTVDVFAKLVDSGLLTEMEQRSQQNLKRAKRLYVRQWAEPSILHTVEQLRNGGFNYLSEHTIFADTGPYYELPKVFFEEEALRGLPLRAILLYMMVLDEIHRSINYGRFDEDGRAWCSMDNGEVVKALGCSDRSLTSAYGDLEEIGLLVRRRCGYGTSQRIYLRDYLPAPTVFSEPPEEEDVPPGQASPEGPEEPEIPFPQNLHYGSAPPAPQSRKFCTTAPQNLHYGDAKSAPLNPQYLHPNNPFSQNLKNQPLLTSIGAGAPDAPTEEREKKLSPRSVYGAIQTQVSYPLLCEDISLTVPEQDREIWYQTLDEVIEIMAKDILFPGLYIRVGDQVLERQQVLANYQGVERYVLYTFLSKVVPRLAGVKSRQVYLHRGILKAVEDHAGAAYYTKLTLDDLRAQADPYS